VCDHRVVVGRMEIGAGELGKLFGLAQVLVGDSQKTHRRMLGGKPGTQGADPTGADDGDTESLCLHILLRPAMLRFPAKEGRGSLYMSARALEFVETWVTEKIAQEGYPLEGAASPAKEWAAECVAAALEEGIPASEIEEAFDDLEEFIDGELEEARERDEDEHDDEDDEEDEEK